MNMFACLSTKNSRYIHIFAVYKTLIQDKSWTTKPMKTDMTAE